MLIQKRSFVQLNPWCRRVLRMIDNPDGEARRMLGAHADEFGDIQASLKVANEEVKRLEAVRLAAVEVSEEALRVLAHYCGDARVFAARRMLRDDLPKLVQKRFSKTGERPKSPTSHQWIQLTVNILDAEAHAVELGHSVLAFPTAAELEEVLEAAEVAFEGASDADIKHREAAARLRQINDRLFKLWRDTGAWFRYSLRDLPKPKQRAIMRRFGFQFADGLDDGPGNGSTPVEEPPEVVDPTVEEPDPEGDPPGGEPANNSGEPTGGSPSGGEPSGGEPSGGEPPETNGSEVGNSGSQSTSGTQTTGQTQSPSGSSQPTGSDRDVDQPTGTTQTPPIVSSDPSTENNGRDLKRSPRGKG